VVTSSGVTRRKGGGGKGAVPHGRSRKEEARSWKVRGPNQELRGAYKEKWNINMEGPPVKTSWRRHLARETTTEWKSVGAVEITER